jgi:hypothetical protein
LVLIPVEKAHSAERMTFVAADARLLDAAKTERLSNMNPEG